MAMTTTSEEYQAKAEEALVQLAEAKTDGERQRLRRPCRAVKHPAGTTSRRAAESR